MRIGIMGYGMVGGALKVALENSHEIIYWDKYKNTPYEIKDLEDCYVIFLCVPTPILKSGAIDKSALYDSMDNLVKNNIKNKIIVIKSTAVAGTTDELAEKYNDYEFAFCPEFLREKTSIEDMLNMNRVIVGTESEDIYKIVKKIFIDSGYTEDKCKYLHVDTKTAETIKYASNTFLATKITFANELYNICDSLGVDYETVVNAICLDKRIDRSYGWKVPGDDGKKGYSQRCLPKDLSAFIHLAKESGYFPNFLQEVWRSNIDFRGEQDWLDISGVKGRDME